MILNYTIILFMQAFIVFIEQNKELSLLRYITHCDNGIRNKSDIQSFMQPCIVLIKGSLKQVIYSLYFDIDAPLQNISFVSAREVTSILIPQTNLTRGWCDMFQMHI